MRKRCVVSTRIRHHVDEPTDRAIARLITDALETFVMTGILPGPACSSGGSLNCFVEQKPED